MPEPVSIDIEAVRQRAERAHVWAITDRRVTPAVVQIYFERDMPALLDEVVRLREENAAQDRTIARLQAELMGGDR